MEDYAIEVKNVSLEFCLYSENVSSIKEYFIKKVKREISKDNFWALKDISFNVKKGEAVGLVGKNGCGKSLLFESLCYTLYGQTRNNIKNCNMWNKYVDDKPEMRVAAYFSVDN